MHQQLPLQSLAQRLRDRQAQTDTTPYGHGCHVGRSEVFEIINALEANTLNEVTLASVVFGDDATASKDWRAIIARIRQDHDYIAQLQGALEELRNTFICAGCGQRFPNTEDQRLSHIANCAQRPAESPLAALLAQAKALLAGVPGDDLLDKCRAVAAYYEAETIDALAE